MSSRLCLLWTLLCDNLKTYSLILLGYCFSYFCFIGYVFIAISMFIFCHFLLQGGGSTSLWWWFFFIVRSVHFECDSVIRLFSSFCLEYDSTLNYPTVYKVV